MWSSEARAPRALALALAALAGSQTARAQEAAQGFALERFYPSAPGGGWLVMDDLDIPHGLGGAIELTADYDRNPLVLTDGPERLTVVQNEAFADVSAAASYERVRVYLDFAMPLALTGHGGTLGGYAYVPPAVNLGTNPDSITDLRIGADVRLVGSSGAPFRLGAGAQLYVPSGSPVDTPASYLTDGTVRAMFRALAAGDLGRYRYAAQLGAHVRPRDDAPSPGGPDGSELLFGAAIGRSFDLAPHWEAVVGPEIFGETAFARFFGSGTTGLEGLLTGRLESTGAGARTRFKLGVGGGLDPQFGAPEWRVVLAVELFSGPGSPIRTP